MAWGACTSLPRPTGSQPKSIEQPIQAEYDEIWGGTLKVLDAYKFKYPIANKDSGTIETEFLQGFSTDQFYYSGGEKFPKERKWRIRIWLLKPVKQGAAIRVKIEKEDYVSSGFLEGWEKVQTDFLDEKILLYRIQRQIDLARLVNTLTTPQ